MQEVLTLKDWLVTQRHFAEEVGEIAFYIVVVLLVIALIQLIPYRWFAKLHILIVPVYLALVWHTIVLANFAYWAQPLGWLLATALFFGSICSLLALFKRIGKPQTATVAKRFPSFTYPECAKMAGTPSRSIPLFTSTWRKPPIYHRFQLES